MKNLDCFEEITDEQLSMITGGQWQKICDIGPGEYQYNTDTKQYRWAQTQDNVSYTFKVVGNGWAGSAAGGYFGPSR